MIDLYKLLGLKRGASKAEVRKAYRRKAKVSHPDKGGSAEAFSALATAHDVLSDERRRERYDATGEIVAAKPDNADVAAIEIIAQKLGLIIHSEHDVSALGIGEMIEQAIREDIARRQAGIADHNRAIERAARLRARVKRKADGADNTLARVLDWHERSAKDLIKKSEDAVSSMERALEILDGYSFIDDLPVDADAEDQVARALRDTIQTLDELAAILAAQPKEAVV
ncbi:MAG: J domain-containing protein [Methyloceanibacter sp.]|jgi:curved DNA-binding protein CbpA